MPHLKAIETIYNSYRFRSRLEARWAVFFDTLGVRYEYEKEGFDLGKAGWYLPDFWLPEQHCWVEIKGSGELSEQELAKLAAFGRQTDHPLYVFRGEIGDSTIIRLHVERPGPGYAWCECPVCHEVEIYHPDTQPPYSSAMMHIPCLMQGLRATPPMTAEAFEERFRTERLLAAYTAARQKRFEHGE